MYWQRILRFLANLGLAAFLIYTGVLVILYFVLLWDKLVTPQFKNINNKEALAFGLLAIALMIVDFFIIRRFIRLIRK
jgi:hypothetical protein